MVSKSLNWKKYRVGLIAAAVALLALGAVNLLGRARVSGRIQSIRDGKGAAAKIYVATAVQEWAPRLGLPVEDRVRMAADLTMAGSAGVWLITPDLPLDTTLQTGESVTRWGSLPVLYVMRFTGELMEIQRARALESIGKNAEAKALAEMALSRVGGASAAHGIAFYTGVLASKVGDHALMERIYDAIGEQHLDNLQFLYNWGLSKLFLKKPGEAVRLLELAGELAHDNLDVQVTLADAYFNAGRKDRAKSLMEKMAKRFPQDGNVAARLKAYAN